MGVVFFEQGEVDIYGHGEIPEGIGGDEHLDQEALELAEVRVLA